MIRGKLTVLEEEKKCFVVLYPAIENDKKGNYYLLFFTKLRKKRLRQKKMRKG